MSQGTCPPDSLLDKPEPERYLILYIDRFKEISDMAKTKVYIDGQSGTTGLQIHERIGSRQDLLLLRIPEDRRHDLDERKKYLNDADIVFLCLTNLV